MSTTAKDITVAAAAPAAIVVVAVDTPNGDAADNGLPDPARCVTLDGSCTYRIAAARTSQQQRTRRSNRGVDTADAKNPWGLSLGAGPRTPRRLVEPRRRSPRRRSPQRRSGLRAIRGAQVVESAADSVAIVRGGTADPPHWPARSGSLASVASVGLPAGRARCSNDSGVGWGDRTARSL